MNRRELIGCALAIPALAAADCRDENGMINPDFDDFKCHDLTLNEAVVYGERRSPRMITGRALFGFGLYDSLLAHQKSKETFPFEFNGMKYRIRVTRLSPDVDQHLGCVVCEVHGRVFM